MKDLEWGMRCRYIISKAEKRGAAQSGALFVFPNVKDHARISRNRAGLPETERGRCMPIKA